jgi:hypothetical protein
MGSRQSVAVLPW